MLFNITTAKCDHLDEQQLIYKVFRLNLAHVTQLPLTATSTTLSFSLVDHPCHAIVQA